MLWLLAVMERSTSSYFQENISLDFERTATLELLLILAQITLTPLGTSSGFRVKDS